jgi:hypothetical protein
VLYRVVRASHATFSNGSDSRQRVDCVAAIAFRAILSSEVFVAGAEVGTVIQGHERAAGGFGWKGSRTGFRVAVRVVEFANSLRVASWRQDVRFAVREDRKSTGATARFCAVACTRLLARTLDDFDRPASHGIAAVALRSKLETGNAEAARYTRRCT